jgi:hypothetical protein
MTRPPCPAGVDPENWHDACLEVERLLRVLSGMDILLHTSYNPHHYHLEPMHQPKTSTITEAI